MNNAANNDLLTLQRKVQALTSERDRLLKDLLAYSDKLNEAVNVGIKLGAENRRLKEEYTCLMLDRSQ